MESLGFVAFIVYSSLMRLDLAASALCDISYPISETAYVGAFEIRFPDSPRSPSSLDPSRCRWLISAYRHEYVIHLDFHDVLLEKDPQHDVCMEQISVYDGPSTTSTVIASFCGREEPTLVTSSRDTLIVFTSNRSLLGESSFTVKYKAVKERYQGGDTSNILRIAFGSFIGSMAFLVFMSWALRKYKQAWSHRTRFLFGNSRINSSSAGGRGRRNTFGAARSREDTRAAETNARPQVRGGPRSVSFKDKFSGFIQGIVIKLSPRRTAVDSSEFPPGTGHVRSHADQPPNNARDSRDHGLSGSLSCACVQATDVSDTNTHSQCSTDAHVVGCDDHVAFGYAIIPVNGFTSDPDAVRPPNYEDCVNTVNPLSLHHRNGQVFFNRAFDMKDERLDCAQIFSPPPPYSEIVQEISMQSLPEESTQLERGLTSSQPPRYQESAAEISSVQMTGNDEYLQDETVREYSCERGEAVEPQAQARSVLSRPGCDTHPLEQYMSLPICEPLTASISLAQPAGASSATVCSCQTHHASESATNPHLDNPVTEEPKNESIPKSNTATPVPMELLCRSGAIPSQSTNNLFWNDMHERERHTDITCSLDPSSRELPLENPVEPRTESHCSHHEGRIHENK